MNKITTAACAFACALAAALPATAQTRAERDLKANPRLAAGKYLAYEAPTEELTPAPEGYQPCYISTYARHGSRYLTGEDKYGPALTALAEAEKGGGLTADGRRALAEGGISIVSRPGATRASIVWTSAHSPSTVAAIGRPSSTSSRTDLARQKRIQRSNAGASRPSGPRCSPRL